MQERDAVDVHAQCWDLLPWLVTGRLGSADRARVEAHVAECALCRQELAEQRRLRQRMSSAERVAYSPAASFEKLWSRIEELEREVPSGAASSNVASTQPKRAQRRNWGRHARASRLSRALVATVLVQAAALAWLAINLLPQRTDDAWPFRTVTSSMPASTSSGAIRVVFDRSVTLGELQDVLAAHGLLIVKASPASEALVLTPATNAATTDVTLILQRLRADHRVRFAELVGGAPAP